MATIKQKLAAYKKSAGAASRNTKKMRGSIEFKNGQYPNPSSEYREYIANRNKERRQSGRQKTQEEIDNQLGRINRLGYTLSKRDMDNGYINTRNTKRVNRAFRLAGVSGSKG